MKAAAQPVSARRVRERSPVASRFCHNRHPQTVRPIAMTANRRIARYLIGQWFDGLVTHSSLRIETKQSLPGERFRSHRAGTGTVRTHRSVRYGCIAYMLACLLMFYAIFANIRSCFLQLCRKNNEKIAKWLYFCCFFK